MDLPKRRDLFPGIRVQVIEKQNQRSGVLTEGVVSRLLTSSSTHPHGIKVMLTDGKVGRVQAIIKPAGSSQIQATQISQSLPIKSSASKPE